MAPANAAQAYGVWNVIARNAQLHGGRPAFIGDGATLTHAAYATACERLAAGLSARGLAAGERIAVLAENHVDIHVLLGAAARLGLILAPLNWRLSEAELAGVLADCDPAMLVCDDATLAIAERLSAARPVRLAATLGAPTDGFARLGDLAGEGADRLPDAPGGEAALLIIYTAAVDGVPRGAVLTAVNLIASATQISATLGLSPDDCFLGNLPVFHIMGQSLAFAAQFAGGRVAVRARFEAGDAAATIARERVTFTGTFPPMLAALLDAAAAGGHDLSSLRTPLGLEAPATIERLEKEWPNARFWTGFGQTEVSGMATLAPASERPGASGRPVILSQVAILDGADRPVAAGTVGEIAVRGPAVMQGYWRRDAENTVVARNGWHHTGDLGRMDDDGWLHYAGRSPAKELIKTGGENVYPAEVEAALRAHDAVTDAIVFGLPDERWGERVVAVVVRGNAPATNAPDEATLRTFVATRIAPYKRPARIAFADDLPKGANGLVDRVAVKERFGGRL